LGFLVVYGVLAAASVTASAQAPRSQWSGVYTPEQSARGAKTFAQKCAACHGADATGGTYGGDVGRGPSLIGKQFANDWNGSSLGDLFEGIHTYMPLDAPGSLSEQQVADLVAFILKAGGYPAGDADLPADIAQLKTYKFLAKDPAAAR
jgi:mono/diheme cytochrome c family protein